MEIWNLFHTFQIIRQISQSVFHIFVYRLGNIGQKSPCADIDEISFPIDQTDIHVTGRGFRHDTACSLRVPCLQSQKSSKVIGCAGRDDAQRNLQIVVHQGVEDDIHSAVAAGSHHNIIIFIHLCHMGFDVPGLHGAEGMHLIACGLENANTDIQVKFESFVAGKRVIKQFHLFHRTPSPLFSYICSGASMPSSARPAARTVFTATTTARRA